MKYISENNEIVFRNIKLGWIITRNGKIECLSNWYLAGYLDIDKKFNTVYQLDKWLYKNRKYLYYAYLDYIAE